MASVQTPQTDYLSQISGTKPIEDPTAKTFGGTTPSSASQQQSAPAQTSEPAPQNPNAFAAPAGVRQAVTADTYNRLFSPVQQQVAKSKNVLDTAQSGFRSQAGESRTYEGIGAENTLNQAIQGNNPSAFEASKALVGAQYTGPQGLDMGAQTKLAQSGEQLKARLPTLGQRAGIQDLVRGANRGLSAGEIAFESGRLASAPGFRRQAQGVQSDILNLFGRTQGATKEAEQYATQRAQEEADIATRSRGLLTGRQGDVGNALDAAVQQARTSDETKQAAKQEFEAAPTYENLLKLNEQGANIDPSLFFTPEMEAARKAEVAKTGIIENERFAAIKDMPPMELAINSHGREQLRLPKEWWRENSKGMDKKQKKALKEMAIERQLFLEKAGFSPGSAASINQKSRRQDIAKQVGEHSVYDPLYFGGAMGKFEANDPRTYVGFTPGMEATRESIATPEQRARYNTIASLLGSESGQLSQADPYSASAITNEAQRYSEEQKKELEDRKKALATSVGKETRLAHKSRQARRHNRNTAVARGVVHGLENVFSYGLGSITGNSVFDKAMGVEKRDINTGRVPNQ